MLQVLDNLQNGLSILKSIEDIELYDIFEVGDNDVDMPFRPITNETIGQLKCGVYNKFGIKRIPKLDNIEDIEGLHQITVRESYYDYLNLIWLHRMDDRIKPKDGIVHICKHAKVLDEDCIVIQCVEHDHQFAKIVSRNIDLLVLIDEIKQYKPAMPVPKNEIFEINELERHGVKFNSAVEKVDEEGFIITNIDHYDNYVYEIYDSLRNTYKHLNKEKERRYAEDLGVWMEEWIDNHQLTNDYDTILEYWDTVSTVIDKFVYKGHHDVHDFLDRQTYGGKLYDGHIKRISRAYEVPRTVCWDIWKIKTIMKMKEILKDLDKKFD